MHDLGRRGLDRRAQSVVWPLLLGLFAAAGLMLAPSPAAAAGRAPDLWGWKLTPLSAHRHRPLTHGALATHAPRARSAIAGGSQTAIGQAPWQVALLGEIPIEIEGHKFILEELCGGVILSTTRVLTAGHCMFEPVQEVPAPAADFEVIAGASNLTAASEPTRQAVAVSGVHIHPYFDYAAGPASDADDVATLTLATPLSLGGSAPQSIALTSGGSILSEGASVSLAGYGEQNAETEELNGKLYSLGLSVAFPRTCGGAADAVFVCASASSGSGCSGDSGSGLTSGNSPATLVGVMDTYELVAGKECAPNAINGFANLAAPEIRDFVAEENTAPPRAPRGGGMSVRAVTRVGYPVICEPGSWSGAPIYTYTFIDSSSGQVLQSGAAAVYTLQASDIGRTVYCQLQATNAGGTGFARTLSLPAVVGQEGAGSGSSSGPITGGGGPTPPVALKEPAKTPSGGISLPGGGSLTLRRGHTADVKVQCTGAQTCTGKLLITAKIASNTRGKKGTRAVTVESVRLSIPAGKTTTVKVVLNALGRGLLRKDHGRLSVHVTVLDAVPGLVK